MPRPAESSHREVVDNSQVNETSEEESISSDQEVVLNPQPSVSTNMYMPYMPHKCTGKSMMGHITDFKNGN